MTKILVIEDELFIRENIVDCLEAEDFEVFSTENGILAILWAQENMPDLVISDVMMPEISGHEILAEMRDIPETELIPFVFLTAMADKDDIRHGMELGADDYLTKPFTRDELLNAVNSRLLKQAKLMKQYYDEQQKTKILKQKIKELEELQIKDKLSREYEQALLKISTAINLVKKIQPKPEDSSNVSLTERNLQTIRESCAAEIAMIRQLPHLEAQLCSKNKMLSLILQRF